MLLGFCLSVFLFFLLLFFSLKNSNFLYIHSLPSFKRSEPRDVRLMPNKSIYFFRRSSLICVLPRLTGLPLSLLARYVFVYSFFARKMILVAGFL